MFLGSRDEVAHLGYVVGKCPKCGNQGVFTVYQAKRKLTVSILASLPVGQQHLLECRACQSRFALPPAMVPELEQRLISADRLADYVGRLPAETGPNGQNPGLAAETLYQIMQVDPYADPEVVEAAFKRLAFKFHPDRSKDPDAAERMRELLSARDVLVDPRKRKSYDDAIGVKPRVRRTAAMRAEEV
ncbi:MAG: J domain-containing protein [Thermomicrobiales bacterium]